jgi:putative oxidoreductase
MTTQVEVMMRTICATDDSTATTMLKLVLGVVFCAHGAQKILGWFGGFGFSATTAMFTGMMHIPAPLAFVAIVAEFCGGLRLLLGCLTRIAACSIGVNMLVAMVTVHGAFGLFMHWTGAQQGEDCRLIVPSHASCSPTRRKRGSRIHEHDRSCIIARATSTWMTLRGDQARGR